ncbi:hypothetical protein JG688_00011410 [Phytophthora aleatoria]|uniref:Uncharacterized protein n=1 Tax=Phytophthora aleatoria TaxID=2496075 RepID=A0A8J5ICQ4_9STRA|nr:hypothetical protein JG688_00011410 [Phytophthora aleatoria]
MKVAEWDSIESAFAKLIYWCALDIFVPFGHCNAQTFVKSRHPDVVQEFFSLVAVLLSDSMLAKVRSEWDYFMVASALTTCNKRGSGMSEWEVKTWGYTHQCNDFIKHSPSPEYDGHVQDVPSVYEWCDNAPDRSGYDANRKRAVHTRQFLRNLQILTKRLKQHK